MAIQRGLRCLNTPTQLLEQIFALVLSFMCNTKIYSRLHLINDANIFYDTILAQPIGLQKKVAKLFSLLSKVKSKYIE